MIEYDKLINTAYYEGIASVEPEAEALKNKQAEHYTKLNALLNALISVEHWLVHRGLVHQKAEKNIFGLRTFIISISDKNRRPLLQIRVAGNDYVMSEDSDTNRFSNLDELMKELGRKIGSHQARLR